MDEHSEKFNKELETTVVLKNTVIEIKNTLDQQYIRW